MIKKTPENVFTVAALALFIISLSILYADTGVGISFGDEGFLWTGTRLTANGMIPIQDFQSYDPGRYYWGAAMTSLLGDSITDLRQSNTVFQLLGIFFSLLLFRTLSDRPAWILIWSSLIAIWLFPNHKAFEPTISLACMYFATRLLIEPRGRNYFMMGTACGLAAVFGRNHGVYAVFACAVLLVYMASTRRKACSAQNLSLAAGGIITGYSPMLLLALLSPGFITALIESVRLMFEGGGTNLSKPIMLPWQIPVDTHNWRAYFKAVSTSGLTVYQIFFALLGGLYLLRKILIRESADPALITGIAFAIPYLHHTLSRPDINHIAQSMMPFVIGTVALSHTQVGIRASAHAKYLPLAILILLTINPAILSRATVLKYKYPNSFTQTRIGDSDIYMAKRHAKLISEITTFVDTHIPHEDPVLLIPDLAIMYPILDKYPPIRDIYLILPTTEEREREIINSLDTKRVNWVFYRPTRYDGRDDLVFSNTYPVVYQYMVENFNLIESIDTVGIYQRKQSIIRD